MKLLPILTFALFAPVAAQITDPALMADKLEACSAEQDVLVDCYERTASSSKCKEESRLNKHDNAVKEVECIKEVCSNETLAFENCVGATFPDNGMGVCFPALMYWGFCAILFPNTCVPDCQVEGGIVSPDASCDIFYNNTCTRKECCPQCFALAEAYLQCVAEFDVCNVNQEGICTAEADYSRWQVWETILVVLASIVVLIILIVVFMFCCGGAAMCGLVAYNNSNKQSSVEQPAKEEEESIREQPPVETAPSDGAD